MRKFALWVMLALALSFWGYPAEPAEAASEPQVRMEAVEGSAVKGTVKVKVSIEGAEPGRSIDLAQIFLRIPDDVMYSSIQWNPGFDAAIPFDAFGPDAAMINSKQGEEKIIPIFFALKLDQFPEKNTLHKNLTVNGTLEVCTITLTTEEAEPFSLTALGFENSKQIVSTGSYFAYFDDPSGTKRALNISGDRTETFTAAGSGAESFDPILILDYSNANVSLQAENGDFGLTVTLSKEGQVVKSQVGRYPEAGYIDGSNIYPIQLKGLEAGTYTVEWKGPGYTTYQTSFTLGPGNETLTVTEKQFYPGPVKPSLENRVADVADFHEMVCAARHEEKDHYPNQSRTDLNRDGKVDDQDVEIFRQYWK